MVYLTTLLPLINHQPIKHLRSCCMRASELATHMRARIFSSHMRETMRGTHMSKFHAPTPLLQTFKFLLLLYHDDVILSMPGSNFVLLPQF